MGSQIFRPGPTRGARQYLPGNALQAVTSVQHTAGLLPPAQGLAVMVAYEVVAVAVASRLIASRDA